jgi:acyl-CoA hydrolase
MNHNIEAMYREKITTIEGALSQIRSGDEIVTGFCGLEPLALLKELHTIRDRVEQVTVWYTLGLACHEFYSNPEYRDTFRTKSWFYSDSIRKAHDLGEVSYQPVHLHNGMLRKLEVSAPRVFIGTVSSMDRHGYFSSSLSLLYEKDFIEKADLVIMEVNPNMPHVHGDTQIHISEIDCLIEVDRPVPQLPRPVLTETDRKIGELTATLVNDGDTIQLGIGRIPDAVAQAFMGKKDLGVHTEMITSSMADLARAGVITGKKKTINKGKIVGTFAFGDRDLYDFIDGNPSIALMRAPYVNHPFIIAQNDNMVSINTALQVDLSGQICSESLGSVQYSGTGGQSDTAIGAIHSRNGRSIIALYATAKKGEVSTIQPFLSQGSVVTMHRNDIDYIITEYGIAQMKGMTIRERAENLIQVAHPRFREGLRVRAAELGIL